MRQHIKQVLSQFDKRITTHVCVKRVAARRRHRNVICYTIYNVILHYTYTSLSLSLSVSPYTCIYIYREREKERDRRSPRRHGIGQPIVVNIRSRISFLRCRRLKSRQHCGIIDDTKYLCVNDVMLRYIVLVYSI